jgi:hypothetical protein
MALTIKTIFLPFSAYLYDFIYFIYLTSFRLFLCFLCFQPGVKTTQFSITMTLCLGAIAKAPKWYQNDTQSKRAPSYSARLDGHGVQFGKVSLAVVVVVVGAGVR